MMTATPEANDQRLTNFIHAEDDAVLQTRQSIRRSSVIRRLRLLLPVIAGGIIAVMFLWSDMDSVQPARPRAEVAPQAVGRNELINPKFVSEDKNRRPFTITAKRAVQNADNMNLIDLDKPVADVKMTSGAGIALQADEGKYEQEKQTLDLDGNVKLVHDDGYELHTGKVSIDINGQTAISNSDVSGQGPAGSIQSKGLTADGKTGVLSFQGPATLTINQVKDGQTKDAKGVPQ